MLPDAIEVVRPPRNRGGFRAAVFDFDGTVSLLREGWSRLMAEVGLEHLGDSTPIDFLEREMLLLSGKPSIHQMRRLAEIIRERTGKSPDPDAMLAVFREMLAQDAGDGVQFDAGALRVDRIREELEYGGLRLRTVECSTSGRNSL